MIERAWPTVVLASASIGLALANWIRLGARPFLLVLVAMAFLLSLPPVRGPALLLVLVAAGCWFGTVRLEVLDRSALAAELGVSGDAEVVVTGPVRRTDYAVRVPAETRLFRDARIRERILLQLPVGRSPPQGAVLALRAAVVAPPSADDGFDERDWLARRGVHVILRGGDWRIVGRRGDVGGFSDRLRAHVARSIAPGLVGERKAVLAGIVLGEDEGLSQELRDDFKAAGLYHLLSVAQLSPRNHTTPNAQDS